MVPVSISEVLSYGVHVRSVRDTEIWWSLYVKPAYGCYRKKGYRVIVCEIK